MKPASKMACATAAFALLHSALASRAAKQAATAIAGERQVQAGYRLFYVGQSFLTFFGLLAYGSRLPTRTLYRVDGRAGLVLRLGQAAGFAHLLAAARPTGLLRLAGWRNLQAYRRHMPIPREPVAQGPEEGPDGVLQVAGPYRWSRHPLNFTGMPILWLTPHMTTRRLAFNLVSSAYFIIGSLHEEVRLRAAYGERYQRYQRNGVPFFWPRPPALQQAQRGAGDAH